MTIGWGVTSDKFSLKADIRINAAKLTNHRKLDALGRRLEVAERLFRHLPRLNARIGRLETSSFDNAIYPIWVGCGRVEKKVTNLVLLELSYESQSLHS